MGTTKYVLKSLHHYDYNTRNVLKSALFAFILFTYKRIYFYWYTEYTQHWLYIDIINMYV